jgi:hypothetical protein
MGYDADYLRQNLTNHGTQWDEIQSGLQKYANQGGLNHIDRLNNSDYESRRNNYHVQDGHAILEDAGFRITVMATLNGSFVTTKEFMPIHIVDDGKLMEQTRELVFDNTLPAIASEEGVPSLIDSYTNMETSQINRFQLAIRFEMDFLATSEGQAQFQAGIVHMLKSLDAQLNIEAVDACKRPDTAMQAYNDNVMVSNVWRSREEQIVQNYCLANKREGGAAEIIESICIQMEIATGGIKPNCIIIDQRKRSLLGIGDPLYAEYIKGGERAVDRQLSLEPIRKLGTCQVEYCPMIADPRSASRVKCILDMTMQIGTFYHFDYSKQFNMFSEKFEYTKHGPREIFDEVADSFVEISANHIHDNAIYLNPNQLGGISLKQQDHLNDIVSIGVYSIMCEVYDMNKLDVNKVKQVKTFRQAMKVNSMYDQAWDQCGYGDPMLNGNKVLDADITIGNLKYFMSKNYPLPFDYLVFRPWAPSTSSSAIVAAGGIGMGHINLGWLKFAKGQDVQNNTMMLIARWRLGCHITNRKRVANVEHLAYNGVPKSSFGGTRFFNYDIIRQLKNSNYKRNDIPAALICLPIVYGSEVNKQPFVSMLGLTGLPSDKDQSFQHYNPAHLYRAALFSDLQHGRGSNRPNHICYQGHMKYVDNVDGVKRGIREEEGHHRSMIFPGGVAERRTGNRVIPQSVRLLTV